MKKRLALVLTVVMAVSLALVGCGQKTPAKEETPTENVAGDKAETDTKEPLKIAYLANGSMGDKSFFESAHNGVKEVEALYGAKVNAIEIGIDRSKWEPALLDASEAGYDLIIIGTFDMEEPLMNVAPLYPDQKYVMFDFGLDFAAGDFSNVYCMTYKGNEGAYLAGTLAALMSKTDVIGFVGGMDIPLINDFLVGFIQGAKEAKPEIKVLTSYVGDFNDPAKAKELALAQYNRGADIVLQGAGNSGLGALDAAKEKGQFIIGTDSDQALLFKDTDPAKADLILTSQLKRVDKTVVRAVDLFIKDELKFGETEVLGLKEGAVELAENEYYEKLVSQEIRDKISEIGTKISDGSIAVDTAFGKSTAEMNAIKESVQP